MQRHTDDGIIIVCDFTGEDWDNESPMIEGHRGSVISLKGLAMAIEGATPVTEPSNCTVCLREIEPQMKAWRHPSPPDTANRSAIICWDCIQQADRAFAKDPDTEWERRIAPDDRWR